VDRGSNRQTHLFQSIGVVGTACWKGELGNWGRPVWAEVAPLTLFRRWSPRASDRVVVLLRLGNASEGKGPDFWCAFEGAEDW